MLRALGLHIFVKCKVAPDYQSYRLQDKNTMQTGNDNAVSSLLTPWCCQEYANQDKANISNCQNICKEGQRVIAFHWQQQQYEAEALLVLIVKLPQQ